MSSIAHTITHKLKTSQHTEKLELSQIRYKFSEMIYKENVGFLNEIVGLHIIAVIKFVIC